MASLDLIEEYIESLIEEGKGMAEIQRALVAELFRCAPSRFPTLSPHGSPQSGLHYRVQAGGGGFIRLTRVTLDDEEIRTS